MSDSAPQSASKKSKPPKPAKPVSADLRYKFIGFEVGSSKVGEFWAKPEEREQYLTTINQHEAGEVRGQSFVNDEPLKEADRWVLAVFGVIALVACFLPWIQYRHPGGEVSIGFFGALANLLGGLGEAFGGGIAVGIGAIFALVVMILTPLLSIWLLVTVLRRLPNEDEYLAAVRNVTRLFYIPLVAAIVTVILATVGGHVASIDSIGIYGASESFGIVTLFSMISFGVAGPIAVSFMAAMKSNDL